MDEKLIISLAFFVCLGIIIKTSGRKILALTDKKRTDISSEISSREDSLELAQARTKDATDSLQARREEIDASLTREKTLAREALQEVLSSEKSVRDNSLNTLAKTSERIKSELQSSFDLVAWEVSKQCFLDSLNSSLPESVALFHRKFNDDSLDILLSSLKRKASVESADLLTKQGLEYGADLITRPASKVTREQKKTEPDND